MSFLINPYVHSSDPLAGQVLLWIKGNGENNSTAIIDESGNNVSLTVYSPTRISTAQSIHGGSSILFGGGYIGTPATGSLRFTTQSYPWKDPKVIAERKRIADLDMERIKLRFQGEVK